jgi:hypothetical protein
MDKVKPLKIETAIDGTQTDPFPVEANPNQDYLATKGISFENTIDKYIDCNPSGAIRFRDLVEISPVELWKLRRALYEVFDPTGSILVSTNTEDAVKELSAIAQNASRAFVLGYYGGNANTGRWLEIFPNIPTNDAPLEVVNALKIMAIFSRTVSPSANCTIGWYDIQSGTPVLLSTTTFSAAKKVVQIGSYSSPVFTLPAGGQLAVRVDSGSINKPHIYFTAQGG